MISNVSLWVDTSLLLTYNEVDKLTKYEEHTSLASRTGGFEALRRRIITKSGRQMPPADSKLARITKTPNQAVKADLWGVESRNNLRGMGRNASEEEQRDLWEGSNRWKFVRTNAIARPRKNCGRSHQRKQIKSLSSQRHSTLWAMLFRPTNSDKVEDASLFLTDDAVCGLSWWGRWKFCLRALAQSATVHLIRFLSITYGKNQETVRIHIYI